MIIERQIAPDYFQHCSTISAGPPGSGLFVAYYTGSAECHDSQHVEIQWFDEDGTASEVKQLESLTGNPILVQTLSDAYIIYSKFENKVRNRIEWWQHCSLWAAKLDVWWGASSPEISVGVPKQIFVDEPGDGLPPKGLGYLPRCNPIWVVAEDKLLYLLPVYREHSPNFHGVILQSEDGYNWSYRGSIGKLEKPSIQPTIWHDAKNNKICALLRNFSRNLGQYAYYSESYDFGKTWTKLKPSKYYNANNSILAISNHAKEKPLIIWNNDPTGRDKLSVGLFDEQNPTTVIQLDNYGSYPAACIQNDRLLVSYTTRANPLKAPNAKYVIKIKEYDLKAVFKTANELSAAKVAKIISS